jgi:hypothetical protein
MGYAMGKCSGSGFSKFQLGKTFSIENFRNIFPPHKLPPETQYEKYKHMQLRVQTHGVVQLHNTLTINAEILEEIIMAASHKDSQLLVIPQVPCNLKTLYQPHTIGEPHLCVAKDNSQRSIQSNNNECTQSLHPGGYCDRIWRWGHKLSSKIGMTNRA